MATNSVRNKASEVITISCNIFHSQPEINLYKSRMQCKTLAADCLRINDKNDKTDVLFGLCVYRTLAETVENHRTQAATELRARENTTKTTNMQPGFRKFWESAMLLVDCYHDLGM